MLAIPGQVVKVSSQQHMCIRIIISLASDLSCPYGCVLAVVYVYSIVLIPPSHILCSRRFSPHIDSFTQAFFMFIIPGTRFFFLS